VHEDLPFDGATMDAVHAEVEQLAAWLGLGRVDYARDAEPSPDPESGG
jgi:uncharacterized protein